MDLVAPREEEYGTFEQAERIAHSYALTKKSPLLINELADNPQS